MKKPKSVYGELLIEDDVVVEWVNLGEGRSGDYDPDDPEDKNLLRFDVSQWIKGELVEVSNASYCTMVEADSTNEYKQKGLETIMLHVHDPVMAETSIKKVCEWLSWLGTDTL